MNHSIKALSKKFAEEEIFPHVDRLEEDLPFRDTLFEKMNRLGLFSLSVTPDISSMDLADALIEISEKDAGIGVTLSVTNMVAESINLFGNAEQKARYLNRDLFPTAIAMTEIQAGSDLKTIQTKAILDPVSKDRFLLSGEKFLITNGDIAAFIIVLAKLETENGEEISAFIVEKGTPGFSVLKKEKKLGLHSANLVDLRFDRCPIPIKNLLGKPGEGLKIALSSLDSGRLGIAAQAIGIARASYKAALDFSQKRVQFGKPIIEHEAIAFMLADMHLKLSASYELLKKGAFRKDQKKKFALEASEAKLFASEACFAIADQALQIHGGWGYTKRYPVEKYLRDARVTRLYEGTSEIQRLIISRHILKGLDEF